MMDRSLNPLTHTALVKRLTVVIACMSLLIPTGVAGARRSTARDLRVLAPRQSTLPRSGFVPGEVLVKFKAGASSAKIDPLAGSGLARAERVADLGIERYLLPAGADVEGTALALAGRHDVEFAEPNYLVWPAVVPNDTYYAGYEGYANDLQRWTFGGIEGDPGINAEAAWDLTTGRRDVTIAIVDSGVSYSLADLAQNIWNNPGEVPGNGVDDDENGYVDDFNGWDFIHNDNDPRPDLGNNRDDDSIGGPDSNTYHGTFVAGCAGARGNDGAGICGAAWHCRVMPVKVFADDGAANTFQIAAAIRYAADMDADVINLSLSMSAVSETLLAGVAYALSRDAVLVAAAGNTNTPQSLYPASFEGVLSVGASQHGFEWPLVQRYWGFRNMGRRAPYSEYGTGAVDVVAPGTVFMQSVASAADAAADATTKIGDPIGLAAGGTSFSAPLVSGLVALILSLDRDAHGGVRTLSSQQIIDIVEQTANDLPDDPHDNPNGGDLWDGHGRVDFLAALQAVPGASGGRVVRIGWRPPASSLARSAPVDLRVVGDSASPGLRAPGPVTDRDAAAGETVTAYRIYRASQAGAGPAGSVLVATVPASQLWFVDRSAPEGDLFYSVTAVHGSPESGPSNEATTALVERTGPRLLSPALVKEKLSLGAEGSGIHEGARLVVNGTEIFPLVRSKNGSKWLVKRSSVGQPSGRSIALAIPAGSQVTLQVIDADGRRSPEVSFQR